jgi:hypothetical protein
MTSRKAKSRKSTVKAAAIKPAVAKSSPAPTASNPVLVVLGYGDRQTPQGARFDRADRDLVAKAADLMGLNLYEATSPEAIAAAENLPAGRLYATGRGFVPNIRGALYSQVLAALTAGPNPPAPAQFGKDGLPPARGLPRTWDEVGPGHLVIAQESHANGWWEAIVLARQGDMFTIRFRDYPKLPNYIRHSSSIALLGFPPEEPAT